MRILEKRKYFDRITFYLSTHKEVSEATALNLVKNGKIINAMIAHTNGKEYIRGKVGAAIRTVDIPNSFKNVPAIKPLITKLPKGAGKQTPEYDFERDLYMDLLKWKVTSELALFLKGPRQVGKTYLLKKFGAEQFKNVLYIDLTGNNEASNRFLKIYYGLAKETPFDSSDNGKTLFWLNVFTLYDNTFKDSKDTLIIIDEIQENADIFNAIRDIRRVLNSRLAVTGSYLAFAEFSEKYRVSAGDYVELHLNTLSYVEFLKAVGVYSTYARLESFDLNTLSEAERNDYQRIEHLYNIYTQIGGYPSVVKLYLETKGDIDACKRQVGLLLNHFYTESRRYFKDIITDSLWNRTLILTIQDLISKSGNLEAKASMVHVSNPDDLSIRRREKNAILRWLIECNIVGECYNYSDWRNLRETSEVRYYLKDMGIFTYISESIPILKQSDLLGVKAENFVYLYLLTKVSVVGLKKGVFKDTQPHTFCTKNPPQEIDFIMHTQSGKRIAVEVKSSKGNVKSAETVLNEGKVNLILKVQNTSGTVTSNKIVVPIFAIDKGDKYLL